MAEAPIINIGVVGLAVMGQVNSQHAHTHLSAGVEGFSHFLDPHVWFARCGIRSPHGMSGVLLFTHFKHCQSPWRYCLPRFAGTALLLP